VTSIAVSGHRGLTPEVTRFVDTAIRVKLAACAAEDGLVGLSCLADGADQIFATAVLDAGGVLEVVVPATEYREKLPDDAKSGYDELLARASAVHRLDRRESTAEAHMAASTLMVDRAHCLFAVWDGEPARSFGGTADVVAYAEQRGTPVTVIWPAGARRD
jgi:hypothetical protein